MNGSQQQAAATSYSSLLHPAAEKVMLDIKAQGYPGLAYLTPMQARGLMVGLRQLAGDPEPVARVEDIRIPGSPEIPVRLYLPDGRRPLPTSCISTAAAGSPGRAMIGMRRCGCLQTDPAAPSSR